MSILLQRSIIKKDVCKIKITCTGVGWQTKNAACNRTLLLSPEEIKLHNVTVSNVKGLYNGVTCPYCGCFTIVPKDKVPGKKFKLRALTQ